MVFNLFKIDVTRLDIVAATILQSWRNKRCF